MYAAPPVDAFCIAPGPNALYPHHRCTTPWVATSFFLIVSVCLLFLQSSIVGGLVVGIVAAYKDTYVQNSGTLSDGKDHGHVIMTSPATIGLPLIVAPVLDAARLAAINDVSVTVADGSDGAEITYYLRPVEDFQSRFLSQFDFNT